MKYCPDCKEERPVEEFIPTPPRKDGLSTYCRKHFNERRASRRKSRARRGSSVETMFRLLERAPREDLEVEMDNLRAYRERRRPCACEGCNTRVRYRSAYAPYCELHRHGERSVVA